MSGEKRAKVINPESAYFGMIGEVQRHYPEFVNHESPEIGIYRIGLWVKDSWGSVNAMHWHFKPSEIEILN